jgi:hypothetical protein
MRPHHSRSAATTSTTTTTTTTQAPCVQESASNQFSGPYNSAEDACSGTLERFVIYNKAEVYYSGSDCDNNTKLNGYYLNCFNEGAMVLWYYFINGIVITSSDCCDEYTICSC